MKHIRFSFLAATLLIASAASAQKPCRIQGTVDKDVNLAKFYIYTDASQGQPADSVEVKKGKFKIDVPVENPQMATLIGVSADEKSSTPATSFILVSGETAQYSFQKGKLPQLVGKSALYKSYGEAIGVEMTLGSQMNEIVAKAQKAVETMSEEEAMKEVEKLRDEYMAASKKMQESLQNYYAEHGKEEGAMLYMISKSRNLSADIEKVSPEFRNGRFKTMIDEMLAEEARVAAARKAQEEAAEASKSATSAGKMFTDFEAEYDGKVQKLSDYVGKGKFVLVDFWASWCGPCRGEVPNLKEVWEKYHGDRFEVLGVATWDKPDATLKAIEEEGIKYPQIINAQKAGSDAYGILGIPEIILFAPDGTIVKRGLRGSQIMAEVQKQLGE